MGGWISLLARFLGGPSNAPFCEESERRDSVRHPVCDNHALVGWVLGDRLVETKARLKDISLRGARLELDQMPPSHVTKVMVRLGQPLDCDWMDSVVAWCRMKTRGRGHEVGLTFENFLSYDLFSKLVSHREQAPSSSRRKRKAARADHPGEGSVAEPAGDAGNADASNPAAGESSSSSSSTARRKAKSTDPAKRPDRRRSVRYKAEFNHVWITWWDGERHVTREGRFLNISVTGALFEPNDDSLPDDLKKVWVRLIFPDKSNWIEAEVIERRMAAKDDWKLGIEFREPVDYGVFKHMLGCELDWEIPQNVCPEFDTQFWR